MAADFEITVLVDQTIARLTAENETLTQQLQAEAEQALQDWLLVEACKDYDTIDLDPDITGKTRRKNFKALRDKKRNTDKILVALQDLRETVGSPNGDKLRKKFEAETEKYR